MKQIVSASFAGVAFLWSLSSVIICAIPFIIIGIHTAIFCIFWIIYALIFFPKTRKPPNSNWFQPTIKLNEFIKKTVETWDGYKLNYVISTSMENKNKDTKIMLIACPLGQCGLSIYYPLLYHLGNINDSNWIYISYDYRGFWKSKQVNNLSTKNRVRKITVNEFAKDAKCILDAENIDYVDCMIGHSLGVQVTLEFSVLFPNKLKSMILLNGAHGTVFNTAFQPIFRLPIVVDFVQELILFLLKYPQFLDYVRKILLFPSTKLLLIIYVNIFGDNSLKKTFGNDYLYKFFMQYIGNLCDDKESLIHYFTMFQELHSHSVYHLLHKINTKTLIISGFWDLMLPALQSAEMDQQLKNSKHLCDIWSSHATILESPQRCVYEIVQFLKEIECETKS
eukprot:128522_1